MENNVDSLGNTGAFQAFNIGGINFISQIAIELEIEGLIGSSNSNTDSFETLDPDSAGGFDVRLDFQGFQFDDL